MQRRQFRRFAERTWSTIPERFRSGAVLLVHDEAEPDPDNPGVFLLGACEPAFAGLDDLLDAAGDPHARGDRQSLVHLWYGSFHAMARAARTFDWEGELEETILHELTHHWEQRAGLDHLDRFDEAQLINFRRVRGLEVPPLFWRDGERAGPGRWIIDGDLFVELEAPPPWTVDPGDGGPMVTCAPDPGRAWATVPGRGAELDGERGDLIVAQRPPRRPRIWQRWRLFGRKKVAA